MSELITIKNDELKVVISTMGAEIHSIIKDGKERIWQADPAVWSNHTPILFPICGGLKDDKFIFEGKEYNLRKHGYAKFCEFEVESVEKEKAVLLLRTNEEILKQYPFKNEFRVIYILENSSVKVEYNVKNLSGKEMYFSVGAHEAYSCPEGIEEYSIIFEKKENLDANILNGNLLEYNQINVGKDTNELPLKYEYFAVDALVFLNLLSKSVKLKNRKTGETVTVDFPGHEYFLLWTKPGAKYICIEPWCGIQDFVDSDCDLTHKRGIRKLEADGVYSISHKITF